MSWTERIEQNPPTPREQSLALLKKHLLPSSGVNMLSYKGIGSNRDSLFNLLSRLCLPELTQEDYQRAINDVANYVREAHNNFKLIDESAYKACFGALTELIQIGPVTAEEAKTPTQTSKTPSPWSL